MNTIIILDNGQWVKLSNGADPDATRRMLENRGGLPRDTGRTADLKEYLHELETT